MSKYKDFIPQNIALSGMRRIGIRDVNGNRVGFIPLGSLTPPNPAKKLYSFPAISDIHIVYDTGDADYRRALKYCKNSDVSFICICGDIGRDGTESEFAQHAKAVTESGITIPIYVALGNHEYYATTSSSYLQKYTGQPLYYSFTVGDDVFIMVGICSGTEGQLFASGELQWLYETLEANRNKRCFLFQHIPPVECSGDVLGIYPYTKLRNHTESVVFKSFLSHYKNVVFFHGHTHMKYDLQKYGAKANYDKVFGCHSVHIPSMAIPRDDANNDGVMDVITADSEGYVVDVYENGIHLRGRDFVKGEFLPIASYWLDTTLQTIPAGTYTDSTGTIKT